MRRLGAIVFTFSLASALGADEIHLVGGGRISGEIVERTATRIVLETGPGRVTLPMGRVTKVMVSPSALSEFRERARGLAPGDAAGWAALGQWAEQRDLATQAREAYQRAVAIDPAHPQANAGLGRALVDGRWLSEEESYRAQGLVPLDGAWVTPSERESALRERSEANLSERESAARVREAEARARAAEAEAERVEAEAAAASADQPPEYGLPYWPYVYGGGGGARPRHPRHDRPDPEPPPPTAPPARRPRTTSVN
ncbi:MAG TPA: hypothetical protein VI669_13365 [Vicinamibacteria bacterium]